MSDILVLATFPLGPGALKDRRLLAGANSQIRSKEAMGEGVSDPKPARTCCTVGIC